MTLFEFDVDTLPRQAAEALYFRLGEKLGKTAGVLMLRALQDAANMLNVDEFCAANGWARNDYSEAKFRDFQEIGRLLARFDNGVLQASMTQYRRQRRQRDART